eukprot:TRINITY_DN23828_c0_g2_i3.p1 TRINITY_DN23828_c0_g2~~TRINITY_DN23828_c0_g2_i3.p1  ORF type:complete len:285 (-),score=62.00 TRINITY_DN23828_c0_g2_i3:110-964(-)
MCRCPLQLFLLLLVTLFGCSSSVSGHETQASATALRGSEASVQAFRGPYDAFIVAYRKRSKSKLLWMVHPLVHGTAEGTFRAMAELVGNMAFGVVLFLNAVRHLLLGTTRPHAPSILDGLAYGFRGLLLDTLVTPFTQLFRQTETAYQDWGPVTAFIIFLLSIIRMLGGSVLGLLNFVACCLEGLANVLLHEEAQFANFEPQRSIEPRAEIGSNYDDGAVVGDGANVLDMMEMMSSSRERTTHRARGHAGVGPLGFIERMQKVGRAMMDEDEVMEMVLRGTESI